MENTFNFEEHLTKDLQSKKREFENIQEEEVRGIMIRTKAKWISEGERNTKYFMNLEKKKLSTEMYP